MKNNNTLIIFVAVLISSFQTACAQTWCPAGAKWTYGYADNGGNVGYVEFTYSGDTVVNSINCKKLKKTRDGKSTFPPTLFHDELGTEITYEQDSVVYIRTNNNFDTLYNLKASIGDSWKMARYSFFGCDSASNVTVLDTGTIIINSIPLKFLAVNLHFDINDPFDNTDTIIEKIGLIGSYFFASNMCSAVVDMPEGGVFRCYSDNNFSTYKPYYTEACDFIVGIEERKKEISIRIYPSPVSDFITISVDKAFGEIASVEFYNSLGQEVLSSKQLNNIDISELPSGLCFIKITNRRGLTVVTKFLKG